ncbi:MAG: pentapeptide repeat-containing protein [Leptospiraceae bacterium]|nr:pentapeptide repeat-containing protein [Leptospiraceae bacterium]MCB1316283.1 pentapeptide repeat-containing protein [Leptospiraceae bacterium]
MNLRNADLSGLSLESCNFKDSDFQNANFNGTDLQEANFQQAKLMGAKFFKVKLQNVSFIAANLKNAQLEHSNVSGANFWGADLENSIFEPKITSIDSAKNICFAYNLYSLQYRKEPVIANGSSVLSLLSQQCRDIGAYDSAAELIYAIQNNYSELLLKKHAYIEYAFRYVFFELSTKYGKNPGQALKILVLNVIVFGLIYSIMIYKGEPRNHIAIHERNHPDMEPITLNWDYIKRLHDSPFLRVLAISRKALYFSIASTFYFDWSFLNVREWISRMRPDNKQYEPYGMVKVLSGIQSVLGLYLIAMWFLTYFGQPFL